MDLAAPGLGQVCELMHGPSSLALIFLLWPWAPKKALMPRIKAQKGEAGDFRRAFFSVFLLVLEITAS